MAVIYGFFIGMADLIPGISGATVAYVLGIYFRIVKSINNINISSIRDFILFFFRDFFNKKSRAKFYFFLQEKDFIFLGKVILGVIFAVVLLSSFLSYMILNHREITYAFFVGIIVMSIILFSLEIKDLSIIGFYLFFMATGLVVYIGYSYDPISAFQDRSVFYEGLLNVVQNGMTFSSLSKINFIDLFFDFFLIGLIASFAMVLPGISGSFVLLILGKYMLIITEINNFKNSLLMGDIPFIEFFHLIFLCLGIVTGILLMSRLVSYFISRYKSFFQYFILGLLVGALYIIWPFKEVVLVEGYVKNGSEILFETGFRLYTNKNIYSFFKVNDVHLSIISFIIGMVVMILFNIYSYKIKSKERF